MVVVGSSCSVFPGGLFSVSSPFENSSNWTMAWPEMMGNSSDCFTDLKTEKDWTMDSDTEVNLDN